MSLTPGVILAVQFKQAHHVKPTYFSQSLDYTNREEALLSSEGYQSYQDYMANEAKSSGLFHAFSEALTEKETAFYQQKFKEAQEQGGLLWQPIFSFDNDWLIEQGMIQDGVVDDQKMKQATQSAMTQLLKKEKMLGNVYWTGAVHYNTDNIHVHVSMVEKKVIRERGMFKASSLDSAKSKMVAQFLDRTETQKDIDQLMRGEIIGVARETQYQKTFNRHFKQVALIEKKQYGRLSQTEKQVVDTLTHLILKKQFPDAYASLQEKLNQETQYYQRAYGEGEQQLYKRYQVNREQELMSKMGNLLLKQGHQFRQEEQFRHVHQKNQDFKKQQKTRLRQAKSRRGWGPLRKIQKQLNRESQKAISEYEQLIKEAGYER